MWVAKTRSKDRWLRNPIAVLLTLRFFQKREHGDARILPLVVVPGPLFILFNYLEPDEKHLIRVRIPKSFILGDRLRQEFAVIVLPRVSLHG